MSAKKGGDLRWLWVLLGILLSVILIAIFFHRSREEQASRKKEDKEVKRKRLELLNSRRSRLQRIVQKKRNKQRWTDWVFRLAYPLARIVIFSVWLLYCYCARFWRDNPSVEDYLAWHAVGGFVLFWLVFIFYGPFDFLSTLKQVKPRIEMWVYGKYLGIDDAIKSDEEELKEVEKEIDDLIAPLWCRRRLVS